MKIFESITFFLSFLNKQFSALDAEKTEIPKNKSFVALLKVLLKKVIYCENLWLLKTFGSKPRKIIINMIQGAEKLFDY